jgi:hypothetical protein
MVNLLILVGAMIAALRVISPLLRIAIRMLAKLLGFVFFIAAAILLVIAVVTHGAFI